MIILYSLLSYLMAYIVAKSIALVKRKFLGEQVNYKQVLLCNYIDTISSLIFSILFAIYILIFTGGFYKNNYCIFLIIINILTIYLSPISTFISSLEQSNIFNRKTIFNSLTIVIILLEIFAFNSRCLGQNTSEQFYSLDSSLIVSTSKVTSVSSNIFKVDYEGYFVVSDVDEHKGEVFQINFDDQTSSSLTYITIYTTNNNGISWTRKQYYEVNPKFPESCQFTISTDWSDKIKIEVSPVNSHFFAENYCFIKGITFDSPIRFLFSPIRLLVLLGVAYIFTHLKHIIFDNISKFKLLNGAFDEVREKKLFKTIFTLITSCTIFLVAGVIIFSLCNKELFYYTTQYVKDNVSNSGLVDIYADLTYSLSQGRVSLSVEANSKLINAELQGLNIYSPSVRASNGISAYWDHAYYNGNYYCYYGILPCLLVYIPLFSLTGSSFIPKTILAELVGVLILVATFIILLIQTARLLFDQINWKHLLFVLPFALITSLIMASITFKDGYYHEGIYHLPIIYGLINLDLFYIFSIQAFIKAKNRTLSLFLSGLFFVFIICSRPNLLFSVIVVLPLFLSLLFNKRVSLKKRILNFGPMMAILLIGGIAICYYNYVRFNSITEFGQSYQINNDQTNLTYSFDKIIPSLYHWFFQSGKESDLFPFIRCDKLVLSYDDVPYNQAFFGLCFILIFNICFITPFIYSNDKWVKWSLFAIPLLVLIEAYTTYSKAGICPRYLIEPCHFLTIGSVEGILVVFDKCKKQPKRNYSIPVFVTGICIISAYIALNIIFDPFDGRNIGDSFGLLLKLREALLQFNC